MTNEEMDAILLIDPEHELMQMELEQQRKAVLSSGVDWIDEDEEKSDYVPPVRNRHILSAQEWNAILDK